MDRDRKDSKRAPGTQLPIRYPMVDRPQSMWPSGIAGGSTGGSKDDPSGQVPANEYGTSGYGAILRISVVRCNGLRKWLSKRRVGTEFESMRISQFSAAPCGSVENQLLGKKG